jgi:uncharacterized membrane protein YfcA
MTLLTKSNKSEEKERIFAILGGVLAGLINGVFGGGGGMIIVPLLVMLLSYSPKKAHATAILMILPLSIVSSLFYSAFGNLDVGVAIPVGIGVVVGGGVGAFVLPKITNKWLIVIFSIVMAAAGVKMLIF